MKPLKAYINLLLYKLNRAFKHAVINNYPIVAFVDPTTFCNLRCPACPTGVKAGLRTPATLDWELYRSFIDEVGDYLFKLYLYNLGEPLLHKQAPEMVTYAKKKEILVMISTNFSHEYQEGYLERLVESGLDVLMVAMDGTTEESYAKYRRGGNFNLVRKNMARIQEIKRAKGSKTPEVIWQFLVFGHNEKEIPEVKARYREWGADNYWIGGGFLPAASHREDFTPTSLVSFNLYDPRNFASLNAQKVFSEKKPCSWLYGATILNPNGAVSPCCYSPAEKDDFGTYKPGKFLETWNGPRYAKARQLFSVAPPATPDELPALIKRHDGRGMDVAKSLKEGEIICSRCPVPYLHDLVEREVSWSDQAIIDHLKADTSLSPEESQLLDYFTRLTFDSRQGE